MKNNIKKMLKSFFTKNSENIFKVGFINRSELERDIALTNLLEENKDFIWNCALNFSKLKFEKINFRNHGDEKYLEIDKDTKLFFSFFVSCNHYNSPEWWKHVSSTHICLVYKDKPVINLKCTTPQGQRQIIIEYSEVILPFIDDQKEICGQFGAGYGGNLSTNDIDFYYRKNEYISSDDLFTIVKKFIDILNSVYNDNKHILDSPINYEMKGQSKEELMKLNLENVNSFLKNL